MNFFTGIGNVGQDPALRNTPSGRGVTNFNVAIDRRFYQGAGDTRRLVRETDWIPVVAWGPLAEVCAKYLQKGSKVSVEGSIRPRQYDDSNGVRHNTFEVVASKVHFLDKIKGNDMSDSMPSTEGVPTEG
jgi:single-strand DNA-binding protein